MLKILASSFGLWVMLMAPAHSAATAEARETARLSNCPPKKIEVYQQSMGEMGTTIYQVECIVPKTKDESASGSPDAILVKCQANLCSLLRPISLKK